LTLGPSDSKPAEVLSGWARTDDSVKKIEQVGKAYEKLKVKYSILRERMEKGVSAHFESEEEDLEIEEETKCKCGKKVCSCALDKDDEEVDGEEKNEDYEQKRHKRTKA